MWQRAKIVRALDYPQLVGRTVWTDCDNVEDCLTDQLDLDGQTISQSYAKIKVVHINVRTANGRRLSPELGTLEMLPEFAENVPDISLADFFAGKEQ